TKFLSCPEPAPAWVVVRADPPASKDFAMKTPSIALKANAKSTVIEILNARLADAIDLALITKQAHWNLKGPNFIAVHTMLDPMRAAIDEHEIGRPSCRDRVWMSLLDQSIYST